MVTGARSGIGEATARVLAAQLGRLDTVVNNAGVMLNGPIVAAPVEEWERMVAGSRLGRQHPADGDELADLAPEEIREQP